MPLSAFQLDFLEHFAEPVNLSGYKYLRAVAELLGDGKVSTAREAYSVVAEQNGKRPQQVERAIWLALNVASESGYRNVGEILDMLKNDGHTK